MTDPQTGSRLVVVNCPGGGEVKLRKLSPADWITLGNTLRATRKSALRVDLSTGNLTDGEYRKRLDDFDRRPMKYRDVETYVNSIEGQYHVLRMAVERASAGATEDKVDELVESLGHPADWIGIVADLCDLRTREEEPAHPPEGVPSLPGTPDPTSIGGNSPPTSEPESQVPPTP